MLSTKLISLGLGRRRYWVGMRWWVGDRRRCGRRRECQWLAHLRKLRGRELSLRPRPRVSRCVCSVLTLRLLGRPRRGWLLYSRLELRLRVELAWGLLLPLTWHWRS